MAKQTGEIKIIGTIDDLVFYRMGEDYFVRTKSSLEGKRFWKDKVFAGSRRSAGLLGTASAVASQLYRLVPKESKSRELFREITGKVKLKLAGGADLHSIKVWFGETYLPGKDVPQKPAVVKPKVADPTRPFPPAAFTRLRLRILPGGRRRCRGDLVATTPLYGTRDRASPYRMRRSAAGNS